MLQTSSPGLQNAEINTSNANVNEFSNPDIAWSFDATHWTQDCIIKITANGNLFSIKEEDSSKLLLIDYLQDCNIKIINNEYLIIGIKSFKNKIVYLKVLNSIILNKLVDSLLFWSSFNKFGVFNKLVNQNFVVSFDKSYTVSSKSSSFSNSVQYNCEGINKIVNIVIEKGLLIVLDASNDQLVDKINCTKLLESQITSFIKHGQFSLVVNNFILKFNDMSFGKNILLILHFLSIKQYYTINRQKKLKYLKLKHSIKLNLIECGLNPNITPSLNTDTPSEYHCNFQINSSSNIMNRTSSLSNDTLTEDNVLFWRESFEFNQPVNIEQIKINLIKSNKLSNSSEVIGTSVLSLLNFNDSSLQRLVVKSIVDGSELGNICLQVKHSKRNFLINSNDTYKKLERSIRSINMPLLLSYVKESIKLLTNTTTNSMTIDLNEIAIPFIETFQCLQIEDDWLKVLMEDETNEISNKTLEAQNTVFVNTIFRGNTLLTKSMEYHFNKVGKKYLTETIGKIVKDIIDSNESIELDPNRLKYMIDSGNYGSLDNALSENKHRMLFWLEKIWDCLYKTLPKLPHSIKVQLRSLNIILEEKLLKFNTNVIDQKTQRKVILNSISSFLFLRFFCPLILNPQLFGITTEISNEQVRRTLTLIAKVLINFSSLTAFGNKEPWICCMNSFIEQHSDNFNQYINNILSNTVTIDSNEIVDPIFYDTTEFDQLTNSILTSYGTNELPSNIFLLEKYFKLTDMINLFVLFEHNKNTHKNGEDDYIPLKNISMTKIMIDIPFDADLKSIEKYSRTNLTNSATLSNDENLDSPLENKFIDLDNISNSSNSHEAESIFDDTMDQTNNNLLIFQEVHLLNLKINKLLKKCCQLEYPPNEITTLDPYFIELTKNTYINDDNEIFVEANPGKEIKFKNYFEFHPLGISNTDTTFKNEFIKIDNTINPPIQRTKTSRFSKMFLGTQTSQESDNSQGILGKLFRRDKH